MNVKEFIGENKILIAIGFLVILGVLAFDVYHYSQTYGIFQVNSINALLLVPFIVLVCGFGMMLGAAKQKNDFEYAYSRRLSKREKEVVVLINQGKRNQEIAEELFIDLSTVKSHLNKIYRKTGVKNRKGLSEIAHAILQEQ